MIYKDINIPKILFLDSKYHGLSSRAKILYGIYYTNLCSKYISEASYLTIDKGFDDLYMTLSNREVAAYLNINETRVPKLKNELVKYNLLKIDKSSFSLDKLYLTII